MKKTAPPLHEQPTTCLKGVGAQLALKLEKLGLFSVLDLLFHLPYRYDDRTRITPIAQLRPYQNAVIEGQARSASVVFGKRRSLVCRLDDGSGTINLRFFHFTASQKQALSSSRIRCYGEVRPGASGLELYHPQYQVLDDQQPPPLEQTLTPTYHTTEGVTQPRLRSLIEQAFSLAAGHEPSNFTLPNDDAPLLEKLRYLHFPPKDVSLELLTAGDHPYQHQLILEELTAYQLSLLRLKAKRLSQQAEALPKRDQLTNALLQNLPFSPTGAQTRVINEIQQDLSQPVPMMRLLQGDVGAGKTLVAVMAALHVLGHNQQVALMAPTEILAEQHRQSFENWLAPLGIEVAWVSGKQKIAERREQLENIRSGKAKMVVGTHALFQEEIEFDHLSLVIIDEQHRFGVHQRLQLRNKGPQGLLPHQLIMTATPIPRTLAMSAYADLDYSVLDELPPGRQPVETVVISQQRRPQVIERIRHACAEGRQAYWVCTLIEQSETLSAEAAEETAETLQALLPELKIGLIHGRLKPAEKEAIMSAFKAGDLHLLVATTVIEVGVDVPNASVMVIENPERLGLAQLHQLRGRVGRGSTASHCVLLYGDNLSNNGKARLQAMRQTQDGFEIARIDLELRGPGEVLGTRQTGDIQFKIADLQRDLPLMPEAQQLAQHLMDKKPEQIEPLIARWVGKSEQFAQA